MKLQWMRSRWSLVAVTLLAATAGVVAWGGFNTAMEATNSLEFCTSCHVMRDNVFPEYKKTVHYTNRSGVRAICSDCHVPRDWIHKVERKVTATKELYHWALGSIDTREKFEAKRHELARHEWDRMRANDSRECRNCHSFEAMDFHKQNAKSAKAMQEAMKAGKTCIDCHKGIAHTMPDVAAGHRAAFAALQAEAAKLVAGPRLDGLRDRHGAFLSRQRERTGRRGGGRNGDDGAHHGVRPVRPRTDRLAARGIAGNSLPAPGRADHGGDAVRGRGRAPGNA